MLAGADGGADVAKPRDTTLASLLQLVLKRAGARLVAGLSVILWRRSVVTMPSRIHFAPETMQEADAAIAADIYSGVFALAGQVVDVSGGSPFSHTPPSEAWARALHSFDWLVHLEASASELSSSNARALFEEWLASRSANGATAQEPSVAAHRLMAFLVQSPLLLNGAEAGFRQLYMRTLSAHMRRLERAVALMPHSQERLTIAAILAMSGIVVADQLRLMKRMLAVVGEELSVQILPDGGHVSRNPEALVKALDTLVPLREALVRRQVPIPTSIDEAVDRMHPMLRFFRLGDGTFAPFNGAGHVDAERIDTLLSYDDVAGTPTSNARYSGYQRAEAGETVLLMDTGKVPPPGFSSEACAGALSFAFAHGAQRLMVSCGALQRARPAWLGAARATAAQSTLAIADTSSAKVLTTWPLTRLLGPALYGGPQMVEVEREGAFVSASHDGYRNAFGITHHRELQLSPDGLALDGLDKIVGEGRLDRKAYAIRFHLHPSLKVRLDRSRRQAVIALPDGAIWVFAVDEGPPVAVEESVVLVGPRAVRRTMQLVLNGDALTDEVARWHFARHEGALAARNDPS